MTQTIKKSLSSILLATSLVLVGTTLDGCKEKQETKAVYQGFTKQDAEEGNYSLIFDSRTKQERGTDEPQLILQGNPEEYKLQMGKEYSLNYSTSLTGFDYLKKATPIN